MALEKTTNLGIVVEFASLIKEDILARNTRGDALEPMIEPSNRSTFGNLWSTVESSSGVICYENIAGFTIETLVGFGTSGVFGLLAGEGKIIERPCQMAGSTFLEFHKNANGTLFKDRIVMGKARDTVYMLMCIIEIIVTGVAKTLVPKKAFGWNMETMESEFLDDTRTSRGGRVGRKHIVKKSDIFRGVRFRRGGNCTLFGK